MNSGIPPPPNQDFDDLEKLPFLWIIFFGGGGCKDLLDEALSKTMLRACLFEIILSGAVSSFFFTLSFF